MDTEFNKLVEYVANTPLLDIDSEDLNNRLLRNKFELRSIATHESKEFYLRKLLDFLSNVKNYFKNCYYKDDKHIKEIIAFMEMEANFIDDEVFFERGTLRAEKDKANSFETENIKLINEGLK